MGTKFKATVPTPRLAQVDTPETPGTVSPENLKTLWIRRDGNLIMEGVTYNPHNEYYEEVSVKEIPADISNGYYEYLDNELVKNAEAFKAFQERTSKPDSQIQELLLQLAEAQTVIFENQLTIMEKLDGTNNKAQS